MIIATTPMPTEAKDIRTVGLNIKRYLLKDKTGRYHKPVYLFEGSVKFWGELVGIGGRKNRNFTFEKERTILRPQADDKLDLVMFDSDNAVYSTMEAQMESDIQRSGAKHSRCRYNGDVLASWRLGQQRIAGLRK